MQSLESSSEHCEAQPGRSHFRFNKCVAAGVGLVLLLLGAAALLFRDSDTHMVSPSDWPDVLPVVQEGDMAAYLELLTPALAATRLAYVATYGGYYNAKYWNATLPKGWIRMPKLERNPADGGLHALVFFNPASKRSILAFRGTDLTPNGGASAVADRCNNRMLWDDTPYGELPASCKGFSQAKLDYFSEAKTFADAALLALGSSPSQTLLTGHSLGAGLAVLVAAARGLQGKNMMPKVLAFASPPIDAALRNRVGLASGPLAHAATILYNEFDPLFVTGKGSRAGVNTCQYSPTEPDSCKECFAHGFNRSDVVCMECFNKMHTLKRYLDDLRGTVQDPPAFRPHCTALVTKNLVVV